jgi:hypothetical protein
MWILKKKYDYWWKKYGLEKTDRATETSLFDRNWATSLKPRRRSRPLRLVWWALIWGIFRRRGMWLLKKIEKFITLILTDLSMNFYPMIYIAFRRQHPCPFHFHLFCFETNINIQFPELHHPFRDTYCSIIQVFFHYFCPSLFPGWPTLVLSFHVYF